MTDTFKEQLLKYLTGKINIQSGNDQPSFTSISIFQNNLYTYISNQRSLVLKLQ